MTSFGVSAGLACSISATVPLTTGAAACWCRSGSGTADTTVGTVPGSRYAASVVYNVLPERSSDSMPTPGATRSGLAPTSTAVGPRELNVAIVSSERSTVPMWLDAPTVSTHGAFPGAVIPPYCVVPVGAPAVVAGGRDDDDAGRTARCAASVSGSVLYDSYTPAATDKLITRMLQRVALRDGVVERGNHVADVAPARWRRAP